MDESVRPDLAEHDADAPLVRDDSSWFRRQLGDEWSPEEPGIYRFVGQGGSASSGQESGGAARSRKPAPEVETEVLKRKALPTSSDALKMKRESESLLAKQRLAPAEAAALKEKLASTRRLRTARQLRKEGVPKSA